MRARPFLRTGCGATSPRTATRSPCGGCAQDGSGLEGWTWAEVGDRSARLAAAFTRLGLGRGERMLLFLRNRPEFHVADLGAVLAGGTPMSIYNSSAPEQVEHVAGRCRSRSRWSRTSIPRPVPLGPRRAAQAASDHDRGRSEAWPGGGAPARRPLADEPVDLEAAAAEVVADDVATVIYTSGDDRTTQGRDARPTTTSGRSASAAWRRSGRPPDRRTVSYLPMAHVAERMISHWNHVCLRRRTGGLLCPEPAQLGLLPGLRCTRTSCFGPPRIWEKITRRDPGRGGERPWGR